MNAKYVQRGESFDYIPEAAVAAGDIVVIGDVVGVAKLDIPAGKLGALAVNGIYDIAKKKNDVITVGAKIYWDASNEVATVSAGETVLGLAVAASAATDTTVRVLLNAVCATVPETTVPETEV